MRNQPGVQLNCLIDMATVVDDSCHKTRQQVTDLLAAYPDKLSKAQLRNLATLESALGTVLSDLRDVQREEIGRMRIEADRLHRLREAEITTAEDAVGLHRAPDPIAAKDIAL